MTHILKEHQGGIGDAAALFGERGLCDERAADLTDKDTGFYALHLSGGTTDVLAVQGGEIRKISSSLDLHAGQLVDRVGVAMGLGFPAGPELEMLALQGNSRGLLGCSMSDGDLTCHFSGAESQVQRWIADRSIPPENIAKEIYDLLARTVSRMICAGAEKSGFRLFEKRTVYDYACNRYADDYFYFRRYYSGKDPKSIFCSV